jgi:hypothetical protein
MAKAKKVAPAAKPLPQLSTEEVVAKLNYAVKVLKEIVVDDSVFSGLINPDTIKINESEGVVELDGGTFVLEFWNPNYVITAISTGYSYQDGPYGDEVECASSTNVFDLCFKFLTALFADRLSNTVQSVSEAESFLAEKDFFATNPLSELED